MIIAEELIEEYMEHYETGKLQAINMALEDLRLVQTELEKQRVLEIVGKDSKGGENNDEVVRSQGKD